MREARADKRVLKRVQEKVEVEATYLASQVLKIKGQIALDTKHRDCDKAGNSILKIAKILDTGGPTIQSNVTMLNSQMNNYSEWTDQQVQDAAISSLEQTGHIVRRRRVDPE